MLLKGQSPQITKKSTHLILIVFVEADTVALVLSADDLRLLNLTLPSHYSCIQFWLYNKKIVCLVTLNYLQTSL